MVELYRNTIEQGRPVFHGTYCLHNNNTAMVYDRGGIRCITIERGEVTAVHVYFADGTEAQWNTKWVSSYNYQFGLAVSLDGKYVFVQTWEYGLFCLDSRTGQQIWRTKSKRGITNIFVNEDTILCHQHERALQLLDIHTGEVLQEKRPATAWGFTAIDHRHIVCHVTARRWEVIDARTLEVKQSFSHKEFTAGHENFRVKPKGLAGNDLLVRGFRNVWDQTVSPPKPLPNEEFENRVELECVCHEMEELYAELLLWYVGFRSSEPYNELLDAYFMRDAENGILLELEGCSSDLGDSLGRFKRYWEHECPHFDSVAFGARLFGGLRDAYDRLALTEFARLGYALYRVLPDDIAQAEPFHSLCYADDPLDWGDEAQTRRIYETAFAFYRNRS